MPTANRRRRNRWTSSSNHADRPQHRCTDWLWMRINRRVTIAVHRTCWQRVGDRLKWNSKLLPVNVIITWSGKYRSPEGYTVEMKLTLYTFAPKVLRANGQFSCISTRCLSFQGFRWKLYRDRETTDRQHRHRLIMQCVDYDLLRSTDYFWSWKWVGVGRQTSFSRQKLGKDDIAPVQTTIETDQEMRHQKKKKNVQSMHTIFYRRLHLRKTSYTKRPGRVAECVWSVQRTTRGVVWSRTRNCSYTF